MRRWDRVLLLSLLAAGAILAAAVWLNRTPGAQVTVTVDGRETASFPLEGETEYLIETSEGTNLLVISGGEARLWEADCPDRLCVKQGAIRYAGDSIICLPHKVVIEIRGGETGDGLDAMAK